MKKTLRLLALAAAFVLAAPQSHADSIIVTISGTISSLGGNPGFWDPSVTVGTSVSATFLIDTAATPLGGNTASTSGYFTGGTSFPTTISFGDYTFSVPRSEVSLTNSTTDLYQLQGLTTAGASTQNGLSLMSGGIQANLLFLSNTTLGGVSLADFISYPLSDFQSASLSLTGKTVAGNTTTSIGTTITSFSVSNPLAVPEPSTWAMFGVGIGALFLLHRRLAGARA